MSSNVPTTLPMLRPPWKCSSMESLSNQKPKTGLTWMILQLTSSLHEFQSVLKMKCKRQWIHQSVHLKHGVKRRFLRDNKLCSSFRTSFVLTCLIWRKISQRSREKLSLMLKAMSYEDYVSFFSSRQRALLLSWLHLTKPSKEFFLFFQAILNLHLIKSFQRLSSTVAAWLPCKWARQCTTLLKIWIRTPTRFHLVR